MQRTVEYVVPLTEDTQLRHCHIHWKDEVISFVVQLEVHINNKWRAIVRYDTSHGFTHKDIVHYRGEKEKIPLPISDFKEALTFSDKDLKANWSIYRVQFLKEAKNE